MIQITTKAHDRGLHGAIVLSDGSKDTEKQSYQATFKKDQWDIGVGYEKRKTGGWRGYYVEEKPSKTVEVLPQIAAAPGLSGRDRYIVGGRGEKAIDRESYHVKTSYHMDEYRTLSYSYFHTNYMYNYQNPFSFIKNKDGSELFYGSVLLPDGKGFEIYPGDFLGYVGKKEWAVHNFAYDDDKNDLHAHFGVTNIKKDGYSSTGGPEESITATDLQKWNGAGTLSFYPSKTRDFDLHKSWNIKKHTLLAGVAWRSESFEQTRYRLEHWKDHEGKRASYELHGGESDALAGYIQDKWQATNRLAVYAGVRFDRYKKHNGYDRFLDTGVNRYHDAGTYTEWSPKLSVEYHIAPDTVVYAGYGHSFTPPLLYQVYRSENAPIEMVGGQLTVNKQGSLSNPDLRPETADTYEIGIKKSWNERMDLNVAVYRATIKDLVGYFKTEDATLYKGIHYKKGFTQYRNLGDAKRKGVEMEARYSWSDAFSSYVNYAWEEESVNGNRQYDIPKHLLHFGVEFTSGKWDVLADAQYVSARQSPDEATGVYYAEDPFFITNLSVNYAVTPEAHVQFSVYNLFDREFYATEAAGERTYQLAVRYEF